MDGLFLQRWSKTAEENGGTMKRITYIWLAASVLAGVMVSLASAQDAATSNPQEPSLGTYARNARKDKKQDAVKKWDNDNLPREDKLSVVGDASSAANSPAKPQDATLPQAAAADEMPKMTPGQSDEDRQKVIDQWQRKLSEQRAQINSLNHDLDLNQREYRVHSAEYYNDPAVRLNQAQWGKDQSDYKQKLADQQKAVDEAKQKFNDLQEEARRAGVPNSVREDAEQEPEPKSTEPGNAPEQP